MFVELLARSCFSFLEGASQPEEMIEAAASLGLPALALCDRDGLYGSVRAHAQAKKSSACRDPQAAPRQSGVRAIVGAELTLEVDGAPPADPPPSVALLAEDHEGYSNLCALLTTAHADHDKGEAGISAPEIAALADGLVAVVPFDEGWPAGEALGHLRDAFGERLVLAAWRHKDGKDRTRDQAVRAASERFGVPIVASARPLYHHPSRKPLADVVHCIRHKTTLDVAGAALSANAESGLASHAAMSRAFRDRPAWVELTGEIASRCRFSLGELHYRFPSDTLCRPGETANDALARLVDDGCRDRYPAGTPPAVRAQIDKELELIARIDVPAYFLSVREIVQIARERRILCQGRGSAANSAVCYVLGITAVDPARSSLLFERFLSAERAEPPDIDVDFEHERREEVIQELYRRYGRDRAAMVSEVICYRGRSALREVGKAFGLSLDQVDRLAGLVMHYDFEGSPERIVEAGLDPNDERLRKVVCMAGALEGFPRHLSIHVGGFVLSSEPLARVAPIEPARMEGRTVIPWDKDDLDDLGFFKVDVLGLGMLTAVRKTLALIHPEPVPNDTAFDPIDALARIPAEDPAVYDAICHADTIGVFQIESRAQMAMLPRLRPRCFYDIVIEVAIVRPGPIQGGMVHPYLRRRTGKEAAVSPHPCLDEILERTLGVPLFQEQVMQISMTGAGYSPGEADQLRRDMAAWKKTGRLERHRPRLLQGFAERGIPAGFGEQLYQQIQGFGEYGFPECVVGGTLVLDASTGRRVPIEDVVHGRAKLPTTIACDSRLRLRKRRVLAATPSGPREVFRLSTALGREIIATPEHPLLTVDGWRALASLRPGDRIAAARRLPSLGRRRWRRHELVVLADLVAEGNLCHPTTFYFYSTSIAHKDEFVRMVERFSNTRATVRRHHDCFSVHVRRADRRLPCGALEWAERLGLRQKNARQKSLPSSVFELRAGDIEWLLARLWEGDGHVSSSRHASYDTASPTLAAQIQHLLLRLGIVSRVYERARPYRQRIFIGYTVTVTGAENLRTFYERVARRFLEPAKLEAMRQIARTTVNARMSRDVVQMEVRHLVRSARDSSARSWNDIGRATCLGMREIQARRATEKSGFRRWVIERLGRFLRSTELVDLGTSDVYWDAVVSIERVGVRETYDLTIEGDANFLANDLVVHNSHAASFALIVYSSAWLKVHHPAAFACALLNSQPMGFYSPSSIVQDAQRHGVEVRPICVVASGWDHSLERDASGALALRLGMRLVKGLGEAPARAIEAARAAAPLCSVTDLVHRASLRKDDIEALAEAGALAAIVPERREALWRARAPRVSGLFDGAAIEPERDIGLPRLGAMEQLLLDYGRTGLSVSDHPMRHLRLKLDARRERVLRAIDLLDQKHGRSIVVAGLVIGRQRPATASGVTFVTLEDETGVVNLVVRKDVFAAQYAVARHAKIVVARGRLEREGEVIHLLVENLERLDLPRGVALDARSRDFH